jgi:hypothetical protein
VEDVAPCGEIEVVCWVLFEAEGFEGGEVVDCCEDGLLFERLDEAGGRIGRGGY